MAPGASLVVSGVLGGMASLGARAWLTILGVSSARITGGPECTVRIAGVFTGSFELVDSVVEVARGSLIRSGGVVWEVTVDGRLVVAANHYEAMNTGDGPWFTWAALDADGRLSAADRR